MMRGSLLVVGVFCSAAITTQAQEARPNLASLAETTAANIAAFDKFYCQFDVKIGLVTYDDDFKSIQFDHVNGVGHGVWAKRGPVELYDFRQEGESKWDQTGSFRYGPVIYTEGLIRIPGFQLHIQKNGTITSAPNVDFHPRMDPLSLFHIVEGELNVRLPALLNRFVQEQAADEADKSKPGDVAVYDRTGPEKGIDTFRIITSERILTLRFADKNYAMPTVIGYSFANSEGSPWRAWGQRILETETIEGVGTFPKKMLIIHPSIAGDQPPVRQGNQPRANNAGANTSYALMWELKTIEYRNPTAEELTYTADRDLPIMRAGFARITYVNKEDKITPESLPEIFKSLENKLPKKSEDEEKQEAK